MRHNITYIHMILSHIFLLQHLVLVNILYVFINTSIHTLLFMRFPAKFIYHDTTVFFKCLVNVNYSTIFP